MLKVIRYPLHSFVISLPTVEELVIYTQDTHLKGVICSVAAHSGSKLATSLFIIRGPTWKKAIM